MPFKAQTILVMVASPSDVSAERQIVRTVLGEWNDIHSERLRTVLLPVAWETHAVPQMGSRAQEIINRDLLARCDVLVGIFWTRLGSPTGNEASGSVEEVKRHMGAGRPALLYFSNQPVRLDSIDDEQYIALKKFKRECEAQGLVETFNSATEFHDKLLRHLGKFIPDRFPVQGIGESIPVAEFRQRSSIDLSGEARRLLKAGAADRSGSILFLHVMGGPVLQAGGQQLNDPRNAREQASWEAALEELEEKGLIVAKGYKREIFGVTKAGYDVADQLPST